MSTKDQFSAIQYISSIASIAASLGVHLRFGSDFEEFCRIPDKQRLRAPVAPIFDPAVSDIASAKGFWMTGQNDAGEIVHTQAMRLLELDGQSLAEHLQAHLGDYRPHGDKFDTDCSTCYLTPAASAITGRVGYHGELWLKGGPGGYRGGCLAAILPRMFLAMTLSYWEPDFIFGVMEPLAVCRGLAAREGYMHVEQHSILWHDRKADAPFEEWLVWMSRDDARFNMRVPPESLYQLYESQAPAANAYPVETRLSA